jgi:hypothetical protein
MHVLKDIYSTQAFGAWLCIQIGSRAFLWGNTGKPCKVMIEICVPYRSHMTHNRWFHISVARRQPLGEGKGEEGCIRPRIVCLCGSTRFSDAFRDANLRETIAGKIVLTIGCDFKSDDALGLTDADKVRLDELHLRKIDLSDEVLILNVGGYVGESTQRELGYAIEKGKVIRFLESIKGRGEEKR